MRRPAKHSTCQGFTIMEVGLAATVLALTLVGMIGTLEAGSTMLDLSRKQTIAGQILHGEIDEARQLNWASLAESPAGPTTLSTSSGDPNFDPMLATFQLQLGGSFPYTVTRSVACIQPSQPNTLPSSPYASPPILLQVTFSVQWIGITGLKYTRVSTTYVSQYGLPISYQRS